VKRPVVNLTATFLIGENKYWGRPTSNAICQSLKVNVVYTWLRQSKQSGYTQNTISRTYAHRSKTYYWIDASSKCNSRPIWAI